MKKEDNKNKVRLVLIIGALIMIGISRISLYISDKYHDSAGVIFNEANINGRLTDCSANNQGTYLAIDNGNDYWFLPVRKTDNRFQLFCRDSDKGDMVVKDSFNPNLYLIKSNGDTIVYVFVRYFRNGEKKLIGE